MVNLDTLLRQNKGCEQALDDLTDYIRSSTGDPGELALLNEYILPTFAEIFIGELDVSSVYIILTPGKSGSVTLEKTLLSSTSPNRQLLIRTHIISPKMLLKRASFIFSDHRDKDALRSNAMQLIVGGIANYLILGGGLEKFNLKATVLSVLRNDIDVSFASIFQNWRFYFSSLNEINVNNFERALRQFFNSNNPFLLKNWLPSELLPIQAIAKDNTRVRVYLEPFEKVFYSEENLHRFLREIGLNGFRVISDNIGSEKDYSEKYNEMLGFKNQMLARVLLDSPAIN